MVLIIKKHIYDSELAAGSYGKWVRGSTSEKVQRDIGKDNRKKLARSYYRAETLAEVKLKI